MGYRSSVYFEVPLDSEKKFKTQILTCLRANNPDKSDHEISDLLAEAMKLLDEMRQEQCRDACVWHHDYIKWGIDEVHRAIEDAIAEIARSGFVRAGFVRYGENSGDVDYLGDANCYTLHRVLCPGNDDAVDCAEDLLKNVELSHPDTVAKARKMLQEILNRLPK